MITTLVSPVQFGDREATVTGDAYRHLFRARRLAIGDRLRVIDGQGSARWAEVAAVDRQVATLALGGTAPSNEPAYQLDLLVAPVRQERASWLVEKATELGVAAIRFIATERTPRQYGDGTFERFTRVARSAVEQCHRAVVPKITGVHEWSELEGLLHGRAGRYFLDPEAKGGSRPEPQGLAGVVVIGPEGGFAPEEQKSLARLADSLGLGARTLRTETAALVAAALILR